jgi:hypothetical protein
MRTILPARLAVAATLLIRDAAAAGQAVRRAIRQAIRLATAELPPLAGVAALLAAR